MQATFARPCVGQKNVGAITYCDIFMKQALPTRMCTKHKQIWVAHQSSMFASQLSQFNPYWITDQDIQYMPSSSNAGGSSWKKKEINKKQRQHT
jgi:hypothetical protein